MNCLTSGVRLRQGQVRVWANVTSRRQRWIPRTWTLRPETPQCYGRGFIRWCSFRPRTGLRRPKKRRVWRISIAVIGGKFPNGEYEDMKHSEVVALKARVYGGTAQVAVATLVVNLMCLVNRGISEVVMALQPLIRRSFQPHPHESQIKRRRCGSIQKISGDNGLMGRVIHVSRSSRLKK